MGGAALGAAPPWPSYKTGQSAVNVNGLEVAVTPSASVYVQNLAAPPRPSYKTGQSAVNVNGFEVAVTPSASVYVQTSVKTPGTQVAGYANWLV